MSILYQFHLLDALQESIALQIMCSWMFTSSNTEIIMFIMTTVKVVPRRQLTEKVLHMA